MATYVWPVNSKRITQGFTSGHHAIDVGIPTGTKVSSPTKGKVIYAGWNNQGYGNLVEIRTADGKTVYLAHLSQLNARVGQSVDPGTVIGLSGSTGNSTGPHLHYEVRTSGGYSNPLNLGTSAPKQTTVKPPVTAKGQPLPNPKAGTKTTTPTGQPATVTESGAVVPTSSSGSIWGDLITQLKEQFTINWGNVIAAVAGVLLIGIGVFGLVTGEGIRAALQPSLEPVAEAIREGGK